MNGTRKPTQLRLPPTSASRLWIFPFLRQKVQSSSHSEEKTASGQARITKSTFEISTKRAGTPHNHARHTPSRMCRFLGRTIMLCMLVVKAIMFGQKAPPAPDRTWDAASAQQPFKAPP